MLTKKQIKEVQDHLDRAQNPIFFFDNDQDGLCSFLLLQRYVERGRGVVVKTFSHSYLDYFKKISEFGADYVFILDIPVVSEELFEEIHKINLPIVWIDHHQKQENVPDFVDYYNPFYNTGKFKGNEPVTYLCYQISQKKQDIWIAIVGCIGDMFVPEFYSEFVRKYPDLGSISGKAPDIIFGTQIGKLIRIFAAGLKDRTTNVINMLKFLINAKSPYEVLEETNKNLQMHKRFNEIDKKQRKLMEKALEAKDEYENLLFFQYSGDISMSGELANVLRYRLPNKIIIVAYVKGANVNISMRGEKVRDIILKAISGLKNARGGGHEKAVGGQIKSEDLEIFRKRIVDIVERK